MVTCAVGPRERSRFETHGGDECRSRGRYDLIRRAGASGMEQVFEGFDRNLNRRVVVEIAHTNLQSDPE
jgi:hypothetical protein